MDVALLFAQRQPQCRAPGTSNSGHELGSGFHYTQSKIPLSRKTNSEVNSVLSEGHPAWVENSIQRSVIYFNVLKITFIIFFLIMIVIHIPCLKKTLVQ